MLLLNRVFSNDSVIWIFTILNTGFTIFLYCFFKYLNKNGKSLKLWRILCFVPLLLCLIHFVFFHFSKNAHLNKWYYGQFYLAGLLICLLPLIQKVKILKKILFPIFLIYFICANLHTVAMPMVYDSALRNHTRQNYTKAFISTTKDMEKYYSLKDWKKIDIPSLREKFLPVIEEAERTKDDGLMYAAMMAYSYYFYDGHVYTQCDISRDDWLRGLILLSGNDYGFSMIRLEDGSVVAINISENCTAYERGIRNGTIITSWNYVEINKAIEETDFIYTMTLPVKITEDIYKPCMLATKSLSHAGKTDIVTELLDNAKIKDNAEREDAVCTFINREGEEEEIRLQAIWDGLDRMESVFCYLNWEPYEINPNQKNFETVMISDDTGYMLRQYEQSSAFYDILSYFTNRNSFAKNEFIKDLSAAEEKGMKKLIIDARNNSGGFWANSLEFASLFTTEGFDFAYRGTEVFGKVKYLQKISVPADGRFSHIPVVLLVNGNCVSSGDTFVKLMAQCPNVTVMGITPSNCSCQETGGVSILSDSKFYVYYPVNWLYELDGKRFIDTNETRECTIPLDVQIPITLDLLGTLFGDPEKQDDLLEYALNYLNTNQ